MIELLVGLVATVGGFAVFRKRPRLPLRIPSLPQKLRLSIPKYYDNTHIFYGAIIDMVWYDLDNPGKSMQEAKSLRDFLPKNVSPLYMVQFNRKYLAKKYKEHFYKRAKHFDIYPPDAAPALDAERDAYHEAIEQLERKEHQ